jgi:DNA-binding CsgD family transcriptional regulator/PAS domain-containing protein
MSALIGQIYDCAIAPAQWATTLDNIRRELHFANVVLESNDLPSGEPSVFVSIGIEPLWLARVPGYGEEMLQLWGGPSKIKDYPLDEPIVQSQATNRAEWPKNRWASEWVEPQGLIDAVAIVVAREPTAVGNVTFGRHRSAGDVRDDELEVLRVCAPHVRRALLIGKHLETARIEAATLESALDTLEVAIVLVDERLRILHANVAASALFAASTAVRSKDGCLTLLSPVTTDALRTAVALAATKERDLGRRGMGIPLRHSHGAPYVAHVLPLRGSQMRKGLASRAAAAVFVAPAASPPRLPADALALLYDLTPAEARVLELIAEGRTQAEIARTLTIAGSTVKTHLLRVFDKTGCRRQAALVKLASSLSLPL